MKLELDRQLADRRLRKQREQEENALYLQQQAEHLKALEEAERAKKRDLERRLEEQAKSRREQLLQTKERRRKEEKEREIEDLQLKARLIREAEDELKVHMAKRAQEKEYLQKMFEENKLQKQKTLEELERDRLEDIRAQQLYALMLEKQEADRQREIKAREDRQQLYMNRMADTVIRDQDAKAHDEEDKIRRYEHMKEMRERQEEERRRRWHERNTEECKRFLFQQMEERKIRERQEKEHNDEQAKIWEIDRAIQEKEQERLGEKIKKNYKDTAEFLKTQMRRSLAAKMNRNEFLYNKDILRDVNAKLKEHENS